VRRFDAYGGLCSRGQAMTASIERPSSNDVTNLRE
jgi:hypothetical protein